MEYTAADDALEQLVIKKNQLAQTDYNDPTYDALEEELHDLEDDFLEQYGPLLEERLSLVHDEYCPDSQVLSPIAYIGNSYVEKEGKWHAPAKEGVIVEADDFEDNLVRMVLVPKPLRILLNIGNQQQIVAWNAEK
jgi:hypothetical protein